MIKNLTLLQHILICIVIITTVSYAQNSYLFSYSFKNGIDAYNSQQYKKAISDFNNYLAEDSTQERPYVLLSASYIELEKLNSALISIKNGLHHFPASQSLLWLKGEVLLQKKQYDKCLNIYDYIKNNLIAGKSDNIVFNKKQLNIRLGELYRIETGKYFNKKRFNTALTYAKKTKQLFPDSLNSFTNLITIYLKLKKYKKALRISNEGLKKFPANIKLIKLKSTAYYGLKNYKSMLSQYRILYNKNPGDVDIAIVYGELLNINRKYLKANKLFVKLLKEHPRNKKIYNSLFTINENRGNKKGELKVLRMQQKYFPKDTSVYIKIASIYESMNNWKQAGMIYDTLVMLTKDTLRYQTAKAKTFEKRDRLKKSEFLTSEILKRYPDNVKLFNYLGHLQKKQNEWGKALKTYQILNRISPRTKYYINLGLVNEKLQNRNDEYKYYLKAISAGTNDPLPYWGIAKMFFNKSIDDSAFIYSNLALFKSLKSLYQNQNSLLKSITSKTDDNDLTKMKTKKVNAEVKNLQAKKIFTFFTKNFDEVKVRPVLDSLLNLYPGSGNLLSMEAAYFLSKSDTNKSINLYKEAVNIAPKMRDSQIALANIFMKKGKYKTAIGYYNRAVSLNPSKKDAYEGLIKSYRLLNKLNKLCDLWLIKYINIKNNNAFKESLIEALEKAGRYKDAKKIISGKQ